MEEKSWNLGDTVQLASGGPTMTVDHTEPRNAGSVKVVCQWFDKEGTLQRGDFSPGSLIAAATAKGKNKKG